MRSSFWGGFKEMAPQCFYQFAQQSQELHDKFVELVARKANCVSKKDFEIQKQIYARLQERIVNLEKQVNDLQKPLS